MASCVTRRVGKVQLFGDVFNGDEPFKLKSVVDHQQTLQLGFIEQGLGFLWCGALWHGHQPLTRRHDFAHLLVVTGFKTQIAPRHNADHFAVFHHRKARHTQLVRQSHHLTHLGVWGNHNGVTENTRFIAFDLGHLCGLI